MLTQIEIARITEIFLWRPDVTAKDVEYLCTRAKEQKLYGVGVCSALVETAATLLEDSDCKVTALISFPLGSMDADVKRYETEVAIDNGAHEIEVCLNLGRLKDGDTKSMLRELRDINEAADEHTVKAILDLPLLTPREIRTAVEVIQDSGVKFVCAGSGFTGSATPDQVKFLRSVIGPKFGLKASMELRNGNYGTALVEAGATRLGFSGH